MPVIRFNPKSPVPIETGKWICPESILKNEGCSTPRQVARVSGARVYWDARDGEAKFCLRKTVVYIADTREEGMMMYKIEKSRRLSIDAAINAVNAEHDARARAAMERLNAATPGA